MKNKTIDQTTRKTARIIGMFFLVAMVSSLVGGAGFIEPALSGPDGLLTASLHQNQIMIGVMLELINALCVLGIAVMVFPILKQHNQLVALGYLGFRIIEVVWCSMIVVSPIALIALSKTFSAAGAADAPAFLAAGASLVAIRGAVSGLLIPVFFGLGALLLYTAMYQSGRLPRFLAVWGLIAAVLILAMNLVSAFNIELSLTIGMLFALPMITNEIFLGIWLLVRGFNTPVEQQ